MAWKLSHDSGRPWVQVPFFLPCEKEENVIRKKNRRIILRSGPECTLLAQLEHLKTELLVENGCCKVSCGTPTTL